MNMKRNLAATLLIVLNCLFCFSATTPRPEYPRPQFEHPSG